MRLSSLKFLSFLFLANGLLAWNLQDDGTNFEVDYLDYFETGMKSPALMEFESKIKLPMGLRRNDVTPLSKEDSLVACVSCRIAVNTFMTLRRGQNASDETLQKWAEDLCVSANIETRRVCSEVTKLMTPHMLYILDELPDLSAYDFCAIVYQSESCGSPRDPKYHFEIDITGETPPITDHKGPSNDTKSYYKIIHFTDIHYDPAYVPGTNAECGEPICCHYEGVDENIAASKKAGFWGDYRDCDLPWRTAEASMKSIKQQHPDADMVYMTGDVIDHHVWATSQDRVATDLTNIFKAMSVEFNFTTVFPALGNHEPHPVNQYVPLQVKGEFSMDYLYETLADSWSGWLSKEVLDSFKTNGGYYTVQVMPGFRLIALNNNDGYIFNFWMIYEMDYVIRQLQWLHDTLLKAEQDNEKVHILLHIPPARGGQYNVWGREYNRIVERFHHVIAAHFIGHTHKIDFNVFYDIKNAEYATNLIFNGGSLTPFSDVNPNYVVYYMDKTSFEIMDSEFYYFDLDEVNQSSAPPQFKKLFSFREEYDVPDLSPKSLNALIEKWSKDVNGGLRKFWELKGKYGRPYLARNCRDGCLKNELCGIVLTNEADYRRCRSLGA